MVKPHAILNWLELTSNYSWKWFKSFTKPYETNINMRILFVKTFLNQVISTHPHFYIYRPNFRVKNIERILYVRNILLTWVGGWRGGGDGREVHLRDVKVIAVVRILRHSHSAESSWWKHLWCWTGLGCSLFLAGMVGGFANWKSLNISLLIFACLCSVQSPCCGLEAVEADVPATAPPMAAVGISQDAGTAMGDSVWNMAAGIGPTVWADMKAAGEKWAPAIAAHCCWVAGKRLAWPQIRGWAPGKTCDWTPNANGAWAANCCCAHTGGTAPIVT